MSTMFDTNLSVTGSMTVGAVSLTSLTVSSGRSATFSGTTNVTMDSTLNSTLSAVSVDLAGATSVTTTFNAALGVGTLRLSKDITLGTTTVAGKVDGNTTGASSVVFTGALTATSAATYLLGNVRIDIAPYATATASYITLTADSKVSQLWVTANTLIVKKGSGSKVKLAVTGGGTTGNIFIGNTGFLYEQ